MKFEIGKLTAEQAPKDRYVLEIKAMLGDADDYKTLVVGPFPKDKSCFLEEVYILCEEMKHIGGHNYYREYNSAKNFNVWFSDEMIEDENGNLVEDDPRYDYSYSDGWPCNVDYDINYSIQSFNVFYYDQNGFKHNVKIK